MDAAPIRIDVVPMLRGDLDRRRQDFLHAWRAWLATQPAPDEIEAERQSTGRAMSDLARIAEVVP